MVGAARQDPALRPHGEVGLRRPEAGGHRELGHGLLHLFALHLVDDQAESRPQVDQGSGDAAALLGSEHQPGGVFPVAHGQRADLDADGAFRDGGADLQHMGLQDSLLAGHQVVGIVLQERGSFGVFGALRHNLHQAHHGRSLPVALAAEAVPLLHQPLDGKAGQLLQGAQVAEMGDDGMVVLLLQEALEADLDARLHCHMAAELSRVPALVQNPVFRVILLHQSVDVPLAHVRHIFRDLVHRIGVYLPAELDLGFHLVPLGDGHIAHIVRHAHHADVAGLHDAHSSVHPPGQALQCPFIAPMPHDHLALDSHAGDDMAVLPVAVGGLVLVHEIHVDGVVGNLHVELGM